MPKRDMPEARVELARGCPRWILSPSVAMRRFGLWRAYESTRLKSSDTSLIQRHQNHRHPAFHPALLLLLLVALVSGCATGARSYRSDLSPVAHRATRALIGATVTLGAKDVGVSPMLALGLGTVGHVGLSKTVMAIQSPEKLGPWTPGDIACDLIWSAAISPYWAGRYLRPAGSSRRWAWRSAVVAAGLWLGSGAILARSIVP